MTYPAPTPHGPPHGTGGPHAELAALEVTVLRQQFTSLVEQHGGDA